MVLAIVIVLGIWGLTYLVNRYPPVITFRYERDDGAAGWMKALEEEEDKQKRARRVP